MRDIVQMLGMLGITMNYKGYSYLRAALSMVESKEQVAHIRVTKDLYPFVAKQFHTSPQSVEQGISTVIGKCWQSSRRDFVCRLCRCTKKPTVAQFIHGLLCYLHDIDPVSVMAPEIPPGSRGRDEEDGKD